MVYQQKAAAEGARFYYTRNFRPIFSISKHESLCGSIHRIPSINPITQIRSDVAKDVANQRTCHHRFGNSGTKKPPTATCWRRTYQFLKFWWLEVICMIIGFASLLSIIAVLALYNQRELPDWPMNITLNTFVAFFTTLGKATFMIPVSIAISQTQWDWFHQERSLHDMHVFDQASRGAWGSLVLLWRIRFRHCVAFGALLMILSSLTSPITQLAINYPVRSTPVAKENAETFAARAVRSTGGLMNKGLQAAMMTASISDEGMWVTPTRPPSTSTCTTGNCTFGTFQSLGVCMQMMNITSRLRVRKFDDVQPGDLYLDGKPTIAESTLIPGGAAWVASLSAEYNMAHQAALAYYTVMLANGSSFAFSNATNLTQTRIASFALIFSRPVLPDTSSWDISDDTGIIKNISSITNLYHEAFEVLFHLCVQSYETKVEMGVETTRVISEASEAIGLKDDSFLDQECESLTSDREWECSAKGDRWDDVLYLKDPASTNNTLGASEYSIDYFTMDNMAVYMQSSISGHGKIQYHPQYEPYPVMRTVGGDLGAVFFQDVLCQSLFDTVALRNAKVTNFYGNIATSLSAMMRTTKPLQYVSNLQAIPGQAWKEVSFVHISWHWVAFLASELVLATVFLAVTAEARINGVSKRLPQDGGLEVAPNVKDSSLTTLTVLSKECREILGSGIQPMDELEKKAKVLRVKLIGNEIVHVPAEDERYV